MKLLSIILPVYNVENYIVKCLESIYSQGIDINLFEVIAIVDGSPDNSLHLIKEYAVLHTNLIVINQNNGGVSSARNKGIKIAKGKYLMFVDPDDTLFVGSLNEVISSLHHGEFDLVIYRAFRDNSHKEIYSWGNKFNANKMYTGIEVFNKGYSRGSIWGVAYKSQFLDRHKILFPLGIRNSEDTIFFTLCQMKAKCVFFSDVRLYRVFVRPDSASHDINLKRLEQWFNALRLIKEIKQKSINDIELIMIDSINYSILSNIINNAIELLGWNAKAFLEEHRIENFGAVSQKSIEYKYTSRKNKFMKYILNRSFSVYFFITYLRRKLHTFMLFIRNMRFRN